MQVLSYFVNVRDQSFLVNVFKNILQGKWSIKQATTACRNMTMNTKLATAVQFNVEGHLHEQTKSIYGNHGTDLPTTLDPGSSTIKDLIEEICGCTHILLQSPKHSSKCCQVAKDIPY